MVNQWISIPVFATNHPKNAPIYIYTLLINIFREIPQILSETLLFEKLTFHIKLNKKKCN